ncbi:MAG: phage tail sheath subtilisin-like domain-containing protein, partial [Allosphingosinicella sp.]
LAPGVFVEEVSYRAKSIEGVSTTTTGFVGATRYGPTDIEPDVITALVEYERVYGGRQQLEFDDAGAADNYMWNAVRAFFEEGGKRLYVARAFNGDFEACTAKVSGTAPPANVAIRARFPGRAGEARVRLQLIVSQNRLVLEAGKPAELKSSANRDTVYVAGIPAAGVYVLERDVQKGEWNFVDGSGADFELQSLAGTGASVRTITASVFVEPSKPGLPFFAAVGLALDRGHRTGGKPDSIFDYFAAKPGNLAASRTIPIVIAALTPDEAADERDAAQAVATAAGAADTARANEVTAAQQGVTTATTDLGTANQTLTDAQADLAADPNNAALQTAVDEAQEGVEAQQLLLDTATLALSAAQANKAASAAAKTQADEQLAVAQVVFAAAGADTPARSGSQIVTDYRANAATPNRFIDSDLAGTGVGPDAEPSQQKSEGKAPFLDAVFYLSGGRDGDAPDQDAFAGFEDVTTNAKSGLKAFEDVEDISIVAAPGSSYNDLNAQAVANVLIGHAERMQYRIAVVDSVKGHSIGQTREYRAKFDSSHAAFYYPWIRIIDAETGQENFYPPSGFVAGIYARNDVERAVYKAPANEVVTLALGFEKLINKAQQEVMNPEGINCFRYFEGRGMRLWGARTMSSDPEWKYVNLRRYFAYLERSIDKGTQWAVFEPNGDRLWANVRRTIEDFLLNEWQNGALLGDKPEKAYFVKCDRSTMTQNDLDNGRLVCQVGVAALRPAEFVIFRIGQWTADRKA